MKDEITIKEIKEAKKELEDNINALIEQFQTKYNIKTKDIVLRKVSCIERFLDNKKHSYVEIKLFSNI